MADINNGLTDSLEKNNSINRKIPELDNEGEEG